jgi:hypothetical protein
MKWKYILIVIGIYIVAVNVWDSENFQRHVFPEKFWANTVNSLEQQIESDKLYLENTRIELMQAEISSVFEIQKALNTYKASGMDIEEARKLAKEPVKIQLDLLRGISSVR